MCLPPSTLVKLFVILNCLGFTTSHEVLENSHGHYSFSSLATSVKATDSLSFNDIQRVFQKLRFENCTKTRRHQDCNRCFSPVDLGLHKASTLNASEFAAKAVAIVYYSLPEQAAGVGRLSAVCNTSISLPGKLFASIVANFSTNSSLGITVKGLDRILEAVNTTLGPYQTQNKCISAESIIEEVHESSGVKKHGHSEEAAEALDEHDFEKACASIVFHLYQGYCISDSHGHEHSKNLPKKTFFIDDLFKTKKYLEEDDLKKITTKLGIAVVSTPTTTGHDGHAHKRKRRAAEAAKATTTPHNQTCFTLDQMLDVFGISHAVGASKLYFKELCPAFIQQALSGVCAKKTTTKTREKDMPKIWGYGFLAVTIISICSLVGVATIPFIGKTFYKKVLALLVALAVGSLTGDGILHLIPHAFGLHQHKDEGQHVSHTSNSKSFIWKALTVLVSIYIFYVFEVLMHFGLKSKAHSHSHVDVEVPGSNPPHLKYSRRQCSNLEHHEGAPPAIDHAEGPKEAGANGDIVLKNVNAKGGFDSESGSKPAAHPKVEKMESVMESLTRRNVFSAEGHEHQEPAGISSVAWMIIIGDTIHNISDGLAIGAAFSEGGSSGISGGISTSIAVFCHELPHELGDFAVLLSAGMSIKMALFANFMSACSCYIGLIIGILVGQQTEVRLWIFAIAGGMFIYVALVDMLPDLMHSETLQSDTMKTFLLQNIGLLTGFAIMLIIAVFEEDLMAIKF